MDDEERETYRKKLEEEKRKRQEACKHENTKKDRIKGVDTGDQICLDCGKLI